MRVLFLTLYPDERSSRYRVQQYLPHLHRAGMTCDERCAISADGFSRWYASRKRVHRLRYHVQEYVRRSAVLRIARDYDVVVVQKALTLAGWKPLVRRLVKLGVPLVYDIDDAVHCYPPARLPRYLRPLDEPAQAIRLMKAARVVIAGNAALAEAARPYAQKVVVIPTPVDLDRFRPGPPHGGDRFTIGWIGTQNPEQALDPIAGALRLIGHRYRNAILRLIIAPQWQVLEPFFYPLPVEVVRWSAAEEVEQLRGIDAGIMPLVDDAWNRHKCGYKALLYMALGVPAVLSPVGANVEIADGGQCAILARDYEEWLAALRKLAEDPAWRKELGARGRAQVEARYNLSTQAQRLAEVLREAAG